MNLIAVWLPRWREALAQSRWRRGWGQVGSTGAATVLPPRVVMVALAPAMGVDV
jgi:hypothetical protein